MSFLKYHAILDKGRRCQSCCNRCQLFGARDVLSGWEGDCQECNGRWYFAQLTCTSRRTKEMMCAMNFQSLGYQATFIFCRFAGFDFKWMRLANSTRRKVRLQKALLTAFVVDSHDEYFDNDEAAVRRFPLTYLDDCPVENKQLSSALSAGSISEYPSLPEYNIRPSLLDLVSSHLIEPLCPHAPVSDYAFQMCSITQLQANDYVLEQSWTKYSWQGFEWLHNFRTGECFWNNDARPWRAYRYKDAVWWLNGKRWFWEVNGEPDVATNCRR